MKKTLLLSVAASAIAFAGGDIAPVQPVVPAAAPAACDFWGSIGVRYEAVKDSSSLNKFAKGDGTARLTTVLGVEKELGYGFGFGAELAGTVQRNDKLKNNNESAELSQLYLTYKVGNTAIKAGRQALPKAVSPWAWTDRTVGRADNTFNAITVVNTDLADTTLVGAWVPQVAKGNTLGLPGNYKLNGSNKGVFMLAAIYKGIANTTLSTSAYFMPKNGTKGKAFSVWAAAETKVQNFDLGLQVAYAKANAGSDVIALGAPANGTKASLGVAAYASTNFNGLDVKLTAAYINKGAATLNLGGTSAFWGNVGYSSFGGNVSAGVKQKIAKLDLGYKIEGYGKVYGGVAYDKASGGTGAQLKKAIAARIGYSTKIAGVNTKIEYRYTKTTPVTGTATKVQKVRVEGIYKF